MPIVTMGMMAPPTVALLAVSEAITPSSQPVPKRSGVLESDLAAP